MFINMGSLTGQLAMAFVAKNIGFWFALYPVSG